MSLKEMCVHCLDLQQIPRPEKKKVQTKCYSNSSSFLTPGKGKLFHDWRSFKNFSVRLHILTEKKKMVLDFITESLTKQEVIQDKESAAFSSEKKLRDANRKPYVILN